MSKKKKRALISVSDKTGVVEFAQGLHNFGWEIISTGGTGKKIAEAGISVTPIREITGKNKDDHFSHRMSSISYEVEGALLYVRGDPEHEKEAAELGIEPIDLVACNLYPFEKAVVEMPDSTETAIQKIDIGGPCMVRAAAKNHAGHGFGDGVTIVVDPDDYKMVLSHLRAENEVPLRERRQLMVKAFERTARYDLAIWKHMAELSGEGEIFYQVVKKVQQFRYGENPHQNGALYTCGTDDPLALDKFKQLGGKEMSYNNYLDLDGALRGLCCINEAMKAETGEVGKIVGIIKHGTLCGAAWGEKEYDVLKKAIEGNLIAIFGGIIITNFPIDKEAARIIRTHAIGENENGKPDYRFVELVIAPEFTPDALEYYSKKNKKNVRLLQNSALADSFLSKEMSFKQLRGGMAVQDPDLSTITSADYKAVTEKEPTEEQKMLMVFGRAITKASKSNNVLWVRKDEETGVLMLIGNGVGQMDRPTCIEISALYIPERLRGAVMVSEAMFPKEDNIELAAKFGAAAIGSVGGSIRDEHVIAKANELGIAMCFLDPKYRSFYHG